MSGGHHKRVTSALRMVEPPFLKPFTSAVAEVAAPICSPSNAAAAVTGLGRVHRRALRLRAGGRSRSSCAGSNRRMSPGWHESATQIASSVEKRIARAVTAWTRWVNVCALLVAFTLALGSMGKGFNRATYSPIEEMQFDSRQSRTYAFSLPVSEGDATGIQRSFISGSVARVAAMAWHSRHAAAAAPYSRAWMATRGPLIRLRHLLPSAEGRRPSMFVLPGERTTSQSRRTSPREPSPPRPGEKVPKAAPSCKQQA